jgi:hypothetical protein
MAIVVGAQVSINVPWAPRSRNANEQTQRQSHPTAHSYHTLLIKVSHCLAAGAFHWSESLSLLLPFYFKMRFYLPFSLLLNFVFLYTKISTAQNTLVTSTITSAPSSVISQTPEMSASSVSSYYNALATSIPLQQGGGELFNPYPF